MTFSFSRSLLLFALFGLCSCQGDKKNKGEEKENPKSINNTRSAVIPDFNADSAYVLIEKQVSFGPRIPATPAQEKCAAWLNEKLKSYTPNVVFQDVSVSLYDGREVPCKNIIGSFNPEQAKRVLLFAHWDTRPWSDRDSLNSKKTFDGADDGGSGVAVLLEIARNLSIEKPAIGIDIAFFDVEDYGPPSWEKQEQDDATQYAIGTQHWADHPHAENYRAYYGILLDMVGAKGATFPQEGTSLQYAPSIVKKVWDAANSLGYGTYFTYEKTNPITDDHVFVNRQNGTPSIDIVNLNKNSRTGFADHWHSQKDNMSIIDKNTLKAVGQTLLQVIYSEGPEI
jgi:hypothetical protein